jgi:hypothetical protein
MIGTYAHTSPGPSNPCHTCVPPIAILPLPENAKNCNSGSNPPNRPYLIENTHHAPEKRWVRLGSYHPLGGFVSPLPALKNSRIRCNSGRPRRSTPMNATGNTSTLRG